MVGQSPRAHQYVGVEMYDAVVVRQGVGEELHQLSRAAATTLLHALSGPL